MSSLSFFLCQPEPPSNLFKRHWIIPALGVNFFLIKVNCHLFLTLIFNTRHLILVIAMTHMEKCELNIGAHMHQNVPIDGSDIKGETEPQTWMYSDLEVYRMTQPTSLKAHTTYFISPTHFRAPSPSAGHYRPSSPFNNHSQRGKHARQKRSRKGRLWRIFLKGKGGRRETESAAWRQLPLRTIKGLGVEGHESLFV